MASLTEVIENYIKRLLKENGQGSIEIRRQELAEKFDCAPSQINYVLDTRFSTEHGYIIESRRGGGGFIRVVKVDMNYDRNYLARVAERLGDQLSQHQAEGIINRFYEEELINDRERALLRAAVNRKTIGLKLPLRDRVRARLLKNMFVALCNET